MTQVIVQKPTAMEFCADSGQLSMVLLYNVCGVPLPFLRHRIILDCLQIVRPYIRLCDLTTYVYTVHVHTFSVC